MQLIVKLCQNIKAVIYDKTKPSQSQYGGYFCNDEAEITGKRKSR